MTRWIACAMVVTTLLAALAPPASAVFCRRKSGILVMRPTHCRAKEQSVALDVGGPPGPPGARGPAGPGGMPPTVVDTRGNVVGVYMGDHAIRRVDDLLLAFPVDDAGYPTRCNLGFASSDCTGPPLIPYSFGTAPPGGFASPVVVLDDTAYYVDAGLRRHDLGSMLGCPVPAEACSGPGAIFMAPDRCCRSFGGPFAPPGFETRTLDLKSLGLVPPFHLEGVP